MKSKKRNDNFNFNFIIIKNYLFDQHINILTIKL